ncbi:uncharacterized protein N7446_002286 [Penicillium canescens]|uniref:Uncharacterized protein n=1 Tax=Penicillium canescens TaxID=5083 RepID=A0AAD6IDS8_PENCN|nr:uncharacterized protein N7446_002286 [Penicillium canescens]KAJ6044089.1 hypothetical protein N7460_005444 [Penicillium canescens]KAJ6055560.1 hypothetical protein N7444_004658 [Penicillium canescens]KAJ6074509.1 hypothetical protein N7446_002286 [Penicillium canescens]
MSLKRKAEIAAVPSSPSVPAPSEWAMMIDGNNYLHSRTRKRFRDDRPSDQVIYQNTLRWIFSAQKQQVPARTIEMDTMDSEPTLETPEEVDPRQQTLHRFFQPTPQQSSSFRPSRQALAPRANETALAQEDSLRRRAFDQMNPVNSSSTSDSNSPGFNQMGADMDMDMDMDSGSGSDGSGQLSKNCFGGMAWV